MTKLQKMLGLMLLTAAPLGASAQIAPQDLATQQAQTQDQLNQQNAQSQASDLQLQQNMAQDRAREQQLFPATPAGVAPYVAPPPPPPPAPPKTN